MLELKIILVYIDVLIIIQIKYQKYTEELYKKDLHDQDNHDGVITHLEPDILECEVMWALGSITTSKASGGDGILAELFQILKDDAVKELLKSSPEERPSSMRLSSWTTMRPAPMLRWPTSEEPW